MCYHSSIKEENKMLVTIKDQILSNLNSYLLDHTDHTFEEIPEVDNIRFELQENNYFDKKVIKNMLKDLKSLKDNPDIEDSIKLLKDLEQLQLSEIGGFGGNMEALEAYIDGYQILVSDNFGNPPTPKEEWSLSFYKKNEFNEFDDEPFFSYTGKKYSLKKAQTVIERQLNKLKNRKK